MTTEPCSNLEKLENRISRTTRWAIGISMTLLLTAGSALVEGSNRAAGVSASLEQHAKADETRAVALMDATAFMRMTRDKQIEIDARVHSVESVLIELKEGQHENTRLLQEIYKGMRK